MRSKEFSPPLPPTAPPARSRFYPKAISGDGLKRYTDPPVPPLPCPLSKPPWDCPVSRKSGLQNFRLFVLSHAPPRLRGFFHHTHQYRRAAHYPPTPPRGGHSWPPDNSSARTQRGWKERCYSPPPGYCSCFPHACSSPDPRSPSPRCSWALGFQPWFRNGWTWRAPAAEASCQRAAGLPILFHGPPEAPDKNPPPVFPYKNPPE